MDVIEATARGFGVETVRHPWESARLQVVRKLVRRHVALENRAIVIDVGCGDGFVVEQLAASYASALFYAVDTALTSDLIGDLRNRLNGRSILPLSSLQQLPVFPHRAASLVLLLDVIEHVADDVGFLCSLRDQPFVDSNTTFLITAPAYQALLCSHDAFLGHHRRYSNRSLRASVERAGFTVIDDGYFFASLLFVRALQLLKEHVLGIESPQASGLVTWHERAVTAAFLAQVLELDAGLSMALRRTGIRLPGLSNYMICKKSPAA